MRSRWLSPRALLLHLALIVWVGGCVMAAYWQIGRAAEGNSLSFMYAVEWPVFAIIGILGWWALLHQEEVDEAKKQARREYEVRMRAEAQVARQVDDDEDPELAAYNDHLAELADKPRKKLWGH